MAGKILKVSSNDLYGSQDERKVLLFAVFEHIKYMNNYAIFCFEGEYDKNKLLYGSIHLKKNSIVIFSVKKEIEKYIKEFEEEYINDKLKEYKILNIEHIDKVEIVSYSEMKYEKLELLDEKSIVRQKVEQKEIEPKKTIWAYILILVLLLFAGGLTLLYFKPDLFTVKYKMLECSNNMYDQEINLNYDMVKKITFDKNNKVDKIDVTKSYVFLDSDKYYNFKDNGEYELYFTNGEKYKFIDNEFIFKVIYEEDSVIDDYDEMHIYLTREGYNCLEKEYEK